MKIFVSTDEKIDNSKEVNKLMELIDDVFPGSWPYNDKVMFEMADVFVSTTERDADKLATYRAWIDKGEHKYIIKMYEEEGDECCNLEENPKEVSVLDQDGVIYHLKRIAPEFMQEFVD